MGMFPYDTGWMMFTAEETSRLCLIVVTEAGGDITAVETRELE